MHYSGPPTWPYDAGDDVATDTAEDLVDRRSFIMSLIGGMAVASLGGLAAAEAAQPATRPEAKPEPAPANDVEAVTAEVKDGLDKAEADYSQYYYYRRRPRYYARPRYYYRPRPRYYYRPRYYARPRYYRRRYW